MSSLKSRTVSAGLCGLAIALLAVSPSSAVPISLGMAGPDNWAILALGNGSTGAKITINNESSLDDLGGPATRSLGLVGDGTLQMSGNGSFDGSAKLGDGGNLTITTGNVFGGGIFGHNISGDPKGNTLTDVSQNALLGQAASDALLASSAANALATSAAFSGISSITGSQTLLGGAGLNVLHLLDLSLGNNEILTLDAQNLGGDFVINVADEFKLNSADIVLTGGLLFDDLIINLIGPGSDVAFTGGGNAASMVGILLAPERKVNLSPGFIEGEIIGMEVSLVSGADLRLPALAPPSTIPEPGTLTLFGLALIMLGITRCRWAAIRNVSP